ncbi:MAG: metallophosphoesterase [Bdellovibrionia bacterium]
MKSILLLLILAACSHAPVSGTVATEPTPTPQPTPMPIVEKATPFELAPLPETDSCGRGWVCISSERLTKYKTLWAMSDLHGNYAGLSALLTSSGLAKKVKDEWVWEESAQGNLVVVVGDLLNKGPASIEVARALFELQGAKSSNLLLVLLGNHEVSVLAGDKGHQTGELGQSANTYLNRFWLRYGQLVQGIITRKELRRETRLAAELRRLPVGARVGNWLFGHSGYIQADGHEVKELLAAEGEAVRAAEDACSKAESEKQWDACEGEYKDLLEGKSFLDYHNWWKKELRPMSERLDAAEISTLVFGHDPDALKLFGQVGATQDRRFIKLDSGMGADQKIQGMRMLKCDLTAGLNSAACVQFDPVRGDLPLGINAKPY